MGGFNDLKFFFGGRFFSKNRRGNSPDAVVYFLEKLCLQYSVKIVEI